MYKFCYSADRSNAYPRRVVQRRVVLGRCCRGFLSCWVFEAAGPSSWYWVSIGFYALLLAMLPQLKRHHGIAMEAIGPSGPIPKEHR